MKSFKEILKILPEIENQIWKWFWKAQSPKKMIKFWKKKFLFILGGFGPPKTPLFRFFGGVLGGPKPPKMKKKIFFQNFIIFFGLWAFQNHFHIWFSISGSIFKFFWKLFTFFIFRGVWNGPKNEKKNNCLGPVARIKVELWNFLWLLLGPFLG